MNRRLSGVLCAVGLMLGGGAAIGQDLLLQPRPGELLVGPLAFSQEVAGIALPLRASAFLVATAESDHLRIHIRAVMDLASLQERIGDLVGTIPLPANDCDHQRGDNLSVRIWGKSLAIQGRTATVTLHGDIDKWICTPFVLRIRQPFDADLPFTLAKGSAQGVVVKLGDPKIGPDGIASQFIRFLGVDINGEVKRALDQAIDPGSLQISIPQYLSLLHPDLTQVDFVPNSGKLAAAAEINVMLDPRAVIELIRAVTQRPQSERGNLVSGSNGVAGAQVWGAAGYPMPASHGR
ncbi:MAG: hypothetical protein ABIS20_18115 [Thermoanaerobaculia bacterium]